MKREILRMKDICKSESSIRVVRNADFHVFEGEIVGLVGKNYSGKSTLMGAVTGETPCDTGEIWIEEQRRRIESIEQARKEGVFLIKEKSSLIGAFTIADTMRLNFAFAGKKVSYAKYNKKCRDTLKLLHVTDSYDTPVRNLNFHKRVLIEIAQALICDARMLVLDNVISFLSSTAHQEMRNVFKVLLIQGISLVLVESQPNIIQCYLNRLCIMRKGKVVAELAAEEMKEDLILSLSEGSMVQSQKETVQITEQVDWKQEALSFQNVYTEDGVIKNLTFTVYKGETFGIWNRNRHSGQAILDLLEGRIAVARGKIMVNEIDYDNRREDKVYRYQLLTVPEEDQLFSNMNIGENINLAALKPNAYLGVVKKEWELRYLVQNLCDDYLSGKNFKLFPNQAVPDSLLARKKISLCRAVAANAKVIVYNNPCLKMDASQRKIFTQDILKTQKIGITQVVISSQLDSLYPFCNRVTQVEMGKIVKNVMD